VCNWASLERGKIDFAAKFCGVGKERNERGEGRGEGEMNYRYEIEYLIEVVPVGTTSLARWTRFLKT